MPSSHVTIIGAAIALVLALNAGCGQEPTANAAIETTSPAGTSTAAASDLAAGRDVALIRTVYAIPAGAGIDVFADDNRIVDGLAYRTVTPYQEIAARRYSLRVRPAGMNLADPLATNSERLTAGTYYTMFVLPGDGEAARLRVVADHNVLPDAAMARLRTVHASRDAGEFDVYATGRPDALFDGVDFQSVTDYQAVDPESARVPGRAHSERGWSPWVVPASIPPSYESVPSGWSLRTRMSTRRSGRRSDRSQRSWTAPPRCSDDGCARLSATVDSVPA